MKITDELLKELEEKARTAIDAPECDSAHDEFWESILEPTELFLALIERIRELEKELGLDDHFWVYYDYNAFLSCGKCGVVQRRDGKNKPCPRFGISIGVRDETKTRGQV